MVLQSPGTPRKGRQVQITRTPQRALVSLALPVAEKTYLFKELYQKRDQSWLIAVPLAPKTDHFKKLYIETIIRNPEKVGLFGYR